MNQIFLIKFLNDTFIKLIKNGCYLSIQSKSNPHNHFTFKNIKIENDKIFVLQDAKKFNWIQIYHNDLILINNIDEIEVAKIDCTLFLTTSDTIRK